jgi:hypothetical protein
VPRLTEIKLSDLRSDRPIYQPLMDALTRGEVPEERLIAVADLRVSPKFRSPEEHVQIVLQEFTATKLVSQEFLRRVLVMERRDGSLWVYDDCAYVAAAQRVDPALAIP